MLLFIQSCGVSEEWVSKRDFLTNIGITDEGFIDCILTTPESLRSPGYVNAYDDSFLKSIHQLTCEDITIEDLTGLEKLVNLESIILSNNSLKKIDINNHQKLKYLYLQDQKNMLSIKILDTEFNGIYISDVSTYDIYIQNITIPKTETQISLGELNANTIKLENLHSLNAEFYDVTASNLEITNSSFVRNKFYLNISDLKDAHFLNVSGITTIRIRGKHALDTLSLNSLDNLIHIDNNIHIKQVNLSQLPRFQELHLFCSFFDKLEMNDISNSVKVITYDFALPTEIKHDLTTMYNLEIVEDSWEWDDMECHRD